MREYVENFMKSFEYPAEAQVELSEAYHTLASDVAGQSGLTRLIDLYQADLRLGYGEVYEYAKTMEQKLGIHRYQVVLIVYICFSKRLKELYSEEKIDDGIWFNSMLDLKYKLLECKAVKNIWGTFVGGWFSGFFKLKRFALGRLQFEISRYDRADYTKDNKTVTRGMTVLDVHIPRTGTRLDALSCDNSFSMAKEFFRDKVGTDPMVFTCFSWMLYPDIMDVFAEKSNIRSFASRFEIIDHYDDKPCEYADMWRIFDMDYTGNIDDYPEDSSLRRNLKAYLKKGGKTGEGYGVFFANLTETDHLQIDV